MQLSILLLLLLLFQTGSANQQTLPVFLLDFENVISNLNMPPNPFAKMSSSLFADIIHDAIKHTDCIIIFVEGKLCPEDISTKDKLGTPYHHLHRGLLDKRVKYIPAVSEPYKTLSKIFQQQQFNVFFLSFKTKLQLLDTSKYLYVFFEDGSNETRAQTLRKHDVIMKEVYFTVRQFRAGPVVAFYTGEFNPIKLQKHALAPIKRTSSQKELGVMVASDGALFRLSGVYSTTSARRAPFNQLPLIAWEKWSRRKLSTTMSYTDFELQFNFNIGEDQWLLDNVALLEGGEKVGHRAVGVGAPWNWSFVCGEPLVLINSRDGSAITISHYQIQPIHPKISKRQDEGAYSGDNKESKKGARDGDPIKVFGRSINCGPYFSTNILSGLLITTLCLGVLLYGLIMLYNCGVNDKFDDPHGKGAVTHTEGR